MTMAPHKLFKYDVEKMLEGIKERPAIWDRTLEIHKNRLERHNAWEEIYRMLDERYDDMSYDDKIATGARIVRKWSNIRDAFVRSLKNKGKPKKKYVLHNQLQFLTKLIDENSEDESELQSSMKIAIFENTEDEINNLTSCSSSTKRKRTDSAENYVPKKIKKETQSRISSVSSRYSNDPFDDSDSPEYEPIEFVGDDLKTETSPSVKNGDESFFASILPTVVKYNEDDRLEFRIQVLSLMKKIKNKRNRQSDSDY